VPPSAEPSRSGTPVTFPPPPGLGVVALLQLASLVAAALSPWQLLDPAG
jgi:hypothetical protein